MFAHIDYFNQYIFDLINDEHLKSIDNKVFISCSRSLGNFYLFLLSMLFSMMLLCYLETKFSFKSNQSKTFIIFAFIFFH